MRAQSNIKASFTAKKSLAVNSAHIVKRKSQIHAFTYQELGHVKSQILDKAEFLLS